MSIQIQPAMPADKDAIISLLQQSQLLTDDLPAGLPGFVIAKENDTCVGVAGLEGFGPVALLRSVAVDRHYQGRQVGAHLVKYLLETAQRAGLDAIYLITTTANEYFERYGFQPVDRQNVPAGIQQTQQFSQLCPASAIVMKRPVKTA